MINFKSLLKLMVTSQASDLFITAGSPPSLKIDGTLTPVNNDRVSAKLADQIAWQIMTPEQREAFDASSECNFAINPPNIGRFRVNVHRHQNRTGMVLRRIETCIPTLEALNLPPIIKDICMYRQGLVILVGGTGSGKSSTLAAMIHHRNQNSMGHIVALEDPIEFIHEPIQCIITQREIGVDTDSYEAALKNTLRQAPDVIVIGEIRSGETMQYAIQFAETGHLVLATLHANNANQALDRIIHFYPVHHQLQILLELSLNLKAIVAQKLIPILERPGRHVAVETLINTPLIANLIRKADLHRLKEAMLKSPQYGMQTFDEALYALYGKQIISYDEALSHADSANDLRLMIKLDQEHCSTPLLENMSLLETTHN